MLTRAIRPLTRLATRSMASDAKRDGLSLTFGSSSNSYYKDIKVKQVDVPSYSGALGILADHVPIVAVVKPGVVTVYEDDGNLKKFFVAAGTITMNEDSSLLLVASEAVALEDLDIAEAQKNLAAANALQTPEAKIQVEVNQAILDAK